IVWFASSVASPTSWSGGPRASFETSVPVAAVSAAGVARVVSSGAAGDAVVSLVSPAGVSLVPAALLVIESCAWSGDWLVTAAGSELSLGPLATVGVSGAAIVEPATEAGASEVGASAGGVSVVGADGISIGAVVTGGTS